MRSSIVLAGGALFLGSAGAIQVALEALAYFAGVGPYARVFGGSPYTIGFIEAHVLAVLIAGALARAARAPTTGSHVFAAGVHLLLGSANVLFWPAFVTFGIAAQGAVVTGLHGAFVLLNARAAWTRRTT